MPPSDGALVADGAELGGEEQVGSGLDGAVDGRDPARGVSGPGHAEVAERFEHARHGEFLHGESRADGVARHLVPREQRVQGVPGPWVWGRQQRQ